MNTPLFSPLQRTLSGLAFSGIVLLGSSLLSGCGMASSGVSTTSATTITGSTQPTGLSGKVHGGNMPVYGAVVNLYAAGTSGYGVGSTKLATTTTDVNGNFAFIPNTPTTTGTGGNMASSGTTNAWSCPSSSSIIYLTAVGGNTTGAGTVTAANTNTASAMLDVLGLCSTIGGNVVINEVSTVAGVFALAPYINPGTSTPGSIVIGSPNTTQGILGLRNAASTVVNMVNPLGGVVTSNSYTGSNPSVAPATTPANPNGVVVTATPEAGKVVTLADILASCINSVTSTSNAYCTNLFGAAVPPPNPALTSFGSTQTSTFTFATAVDTIQAAYYMASNPIDAGLNGAVYSCSPAVTPATNLNCLFSLASGTGAPFQTALATAPTDWTVGITFSSTSKCTSNISNSFFNGPSKEAVDSNGNLWFVNYGNTANAPIGAISPIGVPLACLTNGGANQKAGVGIAFDPSGNLWITNDSSQVQGVQEINGANLFTANGTASATNWPTPYDVVGLAIDSSGNILLSTGDHSDNVEPEFLMLPAPGTTVYTTDVNGASYSPTATFNATVVTAPFYTPASATTTTNIDALAIDIHGSVWGTDLANDLIMSATPTVLTISSYTIGTPTTSPVTYPVTFTTSTTPPAAWATASPAQTFVVNGLTSAQGVTMDHQGFTVTGISGNTISATLINSPLAVSTYAPKPNGYLQPTTAGTEATTPTLTTTTAITDAGSLTGYTTNATFNLNAIGGYVYSPTTGSDTAYTTTVFTSGAPHGAAFDSSNNLYAGGTCCASTNDFNLFKLYSPATALTNAVQSQKYIGGANGVQALVLDGASNMWFTNIYPSVGFIQSAGVYTANSTFFVGEAAATGTAASATTFTSLSPTGSTPSSCSSTSSSTVTEGCPTGGGFVKPAFMVATDIAIDPSGNVWVPQSGLTQTAGNNVLTYTGTSITQIVGAAVPVVTPFSVNTGPANSLVATKP